MNPVTFSTLACPTWPIEQVIEQASQIGYDGIEWRGGSEGHVQPEMSSGRKMLLRKRSQEAGLITLAVTAYTSFVSQSVKERQENLDELRRYTDLAADLGANYVRTFLGELPAGSELGESLYQRLSDCLDTAAEYAESVGVTIVVEPHDDFALSSRVAPILDRNRHHPGLRVIWDIGNAFAAGEDPDEGFHLLRNHIAYVQVKDGKRRGTDWQLCSLGKGDLPLRQAFHLLHASDYQGAFSLEWEYAWHPELDPPEIALPAGLQALKRLLKAAQPESS